MRNYIFANKTFIYKFYDIITSYSNSADDWLSFGMNFITDVTCKSSNFARYELSKRIVVVFCYKHYFINFSSKLRSSNIIYVVKESLKAPL